MKKEEKEIHSLEDLLTYQEVLNIGIAEPIAYSNISLDELSLLGKNYNHQATIKASIYNKLKEDFEKEFPDCPGVLKKMDTKPITVSIPVDYLWLHSKSISPYKNTLTLSIVNYFDGVLSDDTFRFLVASNDDFFNYHKVATSSVEEQKELIKNYLRRKVEYLKKTRNCESYAITNADVTIQETYRHTIKYLNWHIRNMDRLYEYFERPIDLSILDYIDKDSFLAFYIFHSLHLTDLLDSDKIPECGIEKAIEPAENYFLLIDYLKMITKHNYKISFDTYIQYTEPKDGLEDIELVNVTLDDIKDQLNDIYEQYPWLKSREGKITSYEELLSTRASETWKKIQQKESIKRIKGYWELIPKGESLTYTPRTLTRPSIPKTREEKSLKLKESYQLLDDKLDFFDSTNPICELSGINTFDGYKAYVYSNSCVILEKFYTYDSKNRLVPTTGEAIYVMNLFEFTGLSKLTKPEIIEEINSYNNPNVYRIYHSKNWKDKVKKAVSGEGYGYNEESLNYIEELAKELSKGHEKIKTEE